MSSATYWAKREAENFKRQIKDEAEYEKELKRIYKETLDRVQKEIEAFYGRYAASEGISINEAKKRVAKADIEAYERKAKKYVADKEFSKEANEEMRLYNATMRINRLEMLKANIGLEMIAGHEELQELMEEVLQGRTMEELERQAGILGKTINSNAKKANSIVNASFHNATFSDRIWMYQDLLKHELDSLLQSGMIQGKNPCVLAKEIRKRFDVKASDAERLMRTELARVQTAAQKKAFEEMGYEMYRFVHNKATHKGKRITCSDCVRVAEKDNGYGKGIYLVKDMMPGVNAPPLHPNCRCSVAAHEDDAEFEAWLDYLDKGGTTEQWNRLKGKTESAEEVKEPPVEDREYKQMTLEEFKKMKHTITKDERKIVYGKGHFSGYINSSNARKINEILRNGGVLPSDWQEIADTLQNIIARNTLSDDIMVVRYVTDDTLESLTGVKMPVATLRTKVDEFWKLIDDIPNQIKKGHIYTEKGFLSTSGVSDQNVMTNKGIKLEIKAPKGTNCYVTTNNRESEIIFGQNTSLRITGVKIENNRTANIKVVLECVIEQG